MNICSNFHCHWTTIGWDITKKLRGCFFMKHSVYLYYQQNEFSYHTYHSISQPLAATSTVFAVSFFSVICDCDDGSPFVCSVMRYNTAHYYSPQWHDMYSHYYYLTTFAYLANSSCYSMLCRVHKTERGIIAGLTLVVVAAAGLHRPDAHRVTQLGVLFLY